MNYPKIYIHVGAGKTGSSSIQEFFSSNPVQKFLDGQELRYHVYRADEILTAGKITSEAQNSLRGYVCNSSLDKLKYSTFKRHLKDSALIAKSESCSVLVSNEEYLEKPHIFLEEHLLEELEIPVEIVMYIRPPLDWLNSAYWQWGAWSDKELHSFIRSNFANVAWYNLYEQWYSNPNVSKIHVRLMNGDVVEDVVSFLNLDNRGNSIRSNASINHDVIRFFRRNRKYRRGPHDSEVEFFLAKLIDFGKSRPPWVIGPIMRRELFEYLGDQYQNFQNVLSPELWFEMKSDSRWWDESSYLGREEKIEQISEIASADRLISTMIDALMTKL